MTLRYRAIQRVSYCLALIGLVELARVPGTPVFHFGPMDLTALERNGLLVSGDNLDYVQAVLAKVPGLSQMPA
jgi:hypothetical protein